MENNTGRNILIGAIVLIVAIAAIVMYVKSDSSEYDDSANGVTSAPLETTNPGAIDNGTTTATSTVGSTGTTYTLADVATHNSATSCWTTINGGVYDVTNWINKHPGGPQAILSLCGKDGSAAFNGQHGGQARPASELASFKIGTLAK